MNLENFNSVVEYLEGPGVRNWQFTDKGVKLINIRNLVNDKIKLENTTNHLSIKEVNDKYNHFLLEEGDFIMASSGVTWGKIAEVHKEHLPLCLNTSIIKLKPKNEKLHKNYLWFFIKSDKFRTQIARVITGSAQPNFGPSHLKNIQIPVPPLEEQKRIATLLDIADALRQKDKELLQKYDALAQSLFLEMFGDPVKNEKVWEFKTIEQITKKGKTSIKRGPFGGALKKEIFVREGYLVYEQFHALNNDFSMARYFIDEKKFQELKGFEVQPGDIIISCSGVYLGKLAIIPKDAKKGIINQALLKVTLDEQKMRNDFFTFQFTQKSFKETYFDSNRGAGVPNFPPMADFKKFKFICPPIALQNKFAAQIALIEKQKELMQENLEKSEALFQGLLQEAFK